ncbi:plasmid partition protein ParG [Providencia alcalifaciens]|uniref:plasmid partition protein ParG n=1 Tax=Providencia alcalifaciens TaxID=126385 RepID=UPI00044FD7E4|nr:plasmid partition protein ParG [Providencia alcalifaciens]EUD09002.1 protein ParG [Providencia alcalifaciens R90-1475]
MGSLARQGGEQSHSILTKKGKTKRIDLDEDIQTRFKAACAKQNTTIKDVISQFVDDWLRENE